MRNCSGPKSVNDETQFAIVNMVRIGMKQIDVAKHFSLTKYSFLDFDVFTIK